MSSTTKTSKVRCLDCSWRVKDSVKLFRVYAATHARRKGHRVKLETTTTVIYSDTLIYPNKSHSRKESV